MKQWAFCLKRDETGRESVKIDEIGTISPFGRMGQVAQRKHI